jgi:uncharacterized membrane protein
MPLELIVWTSDQGGRASRVLQFLKKREEPEARNGAVLIRDREGQVFVFETGKVDRRYGTLPGVIVGLLLVLLGSPRSERAAAQAEGMGFPAEHLSELRARLQPGGSALVMLADPKRVDVILDHLAPFGGGVWRQAVPKDLVAQSTTGVVSKGR